MLGIVLAVLTKPVTSGPTVPLVVGFGAAAVLWLWVVLTVLQPGSSPPPAPTARTHGANSPIISADSNSGSIAVREVRYPLGEAPQAYRGYVDALTRPYDDHNPLVVEFRRFLGGGRPETDARHFVQNGARAGQTATVVRSLGAQLITTWRLDDLALDGRLSGVSGEPEWLPLVIEKAAARRDEQQAGRPIVVVTA